MNKITKRLIEESLLRLMSVDDYEKLKHAKPYTFKITNKDLAKSLFFFGAKHTADPTDSMFIELRKSFEAFKPDLVMVEAAPGPKGLTKNEFNEGIVQQTIQEVIKRRGEPGFTIRIAVENNIEWFCPEPDRNDEFQYLQDNGFGKEEIQAWALFRNIPIFNKTRGERTFDEFAQSSITSFLEKTGWKLSESVEDVINKGIEMIGEKVDIKNSRDVNKYIFPGKENRIQKLSRLSWVFRDRTILENISSKLKDYNRIFIVYGASHAVIQEPALRYLVSSL
jgi:hypothetical protein